MILNTLEKFKFMFEFNFPKNAERDLRQKTEALNVKH